MRKSGWAAPVVETVLLLGGLSALLAPLLDDGHLTAASLVYLAATLGLAARHGYVTGFAAAITSNLALNLFFVKPLRRLSVADGDNAAALAVFLAVAGMGAFMLSRSRAEAARAKANQAETAALLQVTRQVADASNARQALNALCEGIARTAGARGCALLAGEPLSVWAATVDDVSNQPPSRDELATALEAWRRTAVIGLSGGAGRVFVSVEGDQPAVLRLVGPVEHEALTGSLMIGLKDQLRSTMGWTRLEQQAGRAGELERSGEFKSLLLSSASHDLRTPLTAIKAAASSLRDTTLEWSDQDRAAFLETIESQADRLSRTVTHLLEMSRLEGAEQPRKELIEVGPLLEEAALSATPEGRKVVACAPDGLWVRADYGLLMQAIANLLENAAKYGRAGTPIQLGAAASPGRVELSVTNEGTAIPREELPLLFERFYRGAQAGGETGGGLGLALVKAIAEGAGGTVSAASERNTNTFTISLPAAAPPR